MCLLLVLVVGLMRLPTAVMGACSVFNPGDCVKPVVGQVEAQYIDPEEVSKPLCGSDIGKDCAGLVYCAKKPSSILNQCTQCANDNAVTNGFKTTRADCSRCAGDLKSKDPARKQSAIAFDDGYKKQLTKLGIECSDSILSNYGKEEPTVGLDPNFVDSSYECSCRDACRTYPPSWNSQGTPDVCYKGSTKKSCVVSNSCDRGRLVNGRKYLCC
jgi:hypothetical protein